MVGSIVGVSTAGQRGEEQEQEEQEEEGDGGLRKPEPSMRLRRTEKLGGLE